MYNGDVFPLTAVSSTSLPPASKVSELADGSIRYEKDALLQKIMPELVQKLENHDWLAARRFNWTLDCGKLERPLGEDARNVLASCVKRELETAGYTGVSARWQGSPLIRTPDLTIWEHWNRTPDEVKPALYFCLLCPIFELLCLPRFLYRKRRRASIIKRNEEGRTELRLHVSAGLPPFDDV
jgi:hypothetical protein